MPTTHACCTINDTDDAYSVILARWRVRVVPAILLAVTTIMLGAALWLDADPAGVGTHQQLGLPPCGFLAATGLPCATCGMTTAFTHAVHGRIFTSLITQPAGMVMALATAIIAIISLWALVVGASLEPIARCLWRPATFWLFAGLVLGSWVYKAVVLYWGVSS